MGLPKSGAKGFFEILMPGVFLLLNVLGTFGLLMMVFADQNQQDAVRKFLVTPIYALALILSLGYLLGVALRLFRTEKLDLQSGRFIKRERLKKLGICVKLLLSRRIGSWLIGRTRPAKLYLREPFFYNRWMLHKCRQGHDRAVVDFYLQFWAKRYKRDGRGNTTFFNLCKTIINRIDKNSAAEAYAAEAMTRFVAGSFYALRLSFLLAALDAVIVACAISYQMTVIPLAIALVYVLLMRAILKEFRLLRCKEADTVFNACFANRRKFARYFDGDADFSREDESADEHARVRQQTLESVWRTTQSDGSTSAITLGALVARLKQESKTSPFLSSLYFAGSKVDHPFFVQTDSVAIGLSILPEDAEKAAQRKRHPNQFEVLFVLEGSICLYTDNEPLFRVLSKGDIHEIKKGVCHWITPHGNADAVYLFVKTNPAAEPQSEDCDCG